jgi:hypothetical protein
MGAGPFVGRRQRLAEGGKKRKVFFSEEKKQKTFGRLSRTSPAAYAKSQNFFGSFFQKRTA